MTSLRILSIEDVEADFLLLDEDPGKDIRAFNHIHAVYKKGASVQDVIG